MKNCTATVSLSIFIFASIILSRYSVYSQTATQKNRIFAGVLNFSSQRANVSLLDLATDGMNQEDFFNNSTIIPYYKYTISNHTWTNDTSFYAIIYKDRLFYFNTNKTYPVTLDFNKASFKINDSLSTKNNWKAGYLFNTGNGLLSPGNPFFYNNEDNKISYNRTSYNDFHDLINHVFGSTEKYKILVDQDEKRKKITITEAKEVVLLNYKMFENKYGKDTSLVISKFIGQINSSLGGKLGEWQNKLLSKVIKAKLSGINNLMDAMPDRVKKQMLATQGARSGSNKKSLGFFIYGQSIFPEVASILTRDQLASYLDYLDIYYPLQYDLNGVTKGRIDYAPIFLKNHS